MSPDPSNPTAWSRESVETARSRPRPPGRTSAADTNDASANPLEQVLFEVKRTIVGQDVLLERMAVAMLAGGPPAGRGRARAGQDPGGEVARRRDRRCSSSGSSSPRTWCPADLVGTRVYHQRTGEFEVSLGPVFANLLLADEINRAPAKVQSALLEVMQERQVTIGRETFRVPEPFLVMATQNPIESDGTYPLPEAQVDRFMMKVVVGYPSPHEEHAIVDRALRARPRAAGDAEPARTSSPCGGRSTRSTSTRRSSTTPYASSPPPGRPPRSGSATSTATSRTGRARARRSRSSWAAGPWPSCAGRDYVLPHDVDELALDVLRHRVVLSYEALADGLDADTVLVRVLRAVRSPDVVLQG